MFDGLDAVVLARMQFAFTMSFHIVFPAFSIGLASYLAVLEALWLWTGREVFLNLFNYWLKIFAVAFGMGVVSGIVMSYQFGTNWSAFSDRTGPVIGPLMAYEVLTAFFLEAGFLGVMLFGLERVGHKLHFIATLMVAVGTLISTFWILAANSWMQTPSGYAVNAAGQFIAADWLKVILNPSFPYRLVHMVLAAYLTTALVVGAVGAFHLLRDSELAGPRVMFSMAMWMATLVAPIQILAGDRHGLNTLELQPAKVMAMEGHFQSHPDGAPLLLFGLPDQAAGKVDYSIEIPKLSSLILKHSLDAPLAGLDTVPRENWPPVPIVFWSFRVMVGMGVLMVGLGLFSLWARWRGTLYRSRVLHGFALAMGPAGFIAVLAGWITTESGRQPFTVYGVLRTGESVSPLAAPAVASSLIAFVIVYFAVFATGVLYILRLMATPPHPGEEGPGGEAPARAAGITPAAGTAALAGIPVHIVTVNDYLASRDAEVMSPIYHALGLTVGTILHGKSAAERRGAYACDITYATNKEIAFDYLRDRLALGSHSENLRLKVERLYGDTPRLAGVVMRGLHFAIVDEADSVLVDEARTPLIISGNPQSNDDRRWANEALALARSLEIGAHYRLFLDERRIELTALGTGRIGELGKELGGLWLSKIRREESVRQALTAIHLFSNSIHYIVREGKIEIVDEYTGRIMPDRSWNEGLHQLIEAKEGCEVTERKAPLARISYQRFFRRYHRLQSNCD